MADATPDLLDALRRIPLFAELAADDLAWLAGEMEVVTLAPGERLFRQGEPAEWMLAQLEGTVQTRREDAAAGAPSYTFHAGDLYGVVPFSRMQTVPASSVAVTRARVAKFPRSRFGALFERMPALEPRFVEFLSDRVRESTRREQQFEKLTALGRLSAGLAHELNNPAAAAQRSAAEARRRLADVGRHAAALAEALGAAGGADAEAACAAGLGAPDALRARAAHVAAAGAADDPLDRADREQGVGEWLEAAGADEPWVAAATFAEAGLAAADLDAVLGTLPAGARPAAAAWCEAALAAEAALATVERAAGRVSELVRAVKSYTHMDRGMAAAPVDVREGVETTLTLFAHKLRDRRIALDRDLPAGLPRVRGFAGELNQVWTNLVDNAIDAAADAPDGGPRVTVRARQEADRLVVEVEDNGPGVPDAVRERIWEPFFTTKPVGRGTGLGLDIARHVVVEQHRGELVLDSRPGLTRFAVRLPVDGARPDPA